MAHYLSLTVSVATCLLFVAMFVGSLYVMPKRIREMSRENPTQIKARMVAVAVVCLICPAIVAVMLRSQDQGYNLSVGEWIGMRTAGLIPACLLPPLTIIILFAGPLTHFYHLYKDGGGEFSESVVEFLDDFFPNSGHGNLSKLRNQVAAPLAEEFIFRGCMSPLMINSHLSRNTVIFFTPMLFGFAHLHHAYGMIKQGKALQEALVIVTVQFVYTSLFGALEMYYFLRTGHVVSVFLIHSWCNLLGLPPLGGMFDEQHPNYEHRKSIGLAYITGIVLFCVLLGPLTSPSIYGNELWDIAGKK